MKLCGLDFETANGKSGSICAVGCVVIEDGKLIEKREYLVKPHKKLDFMSAECYMIHGINYYDLRNAPEFSEIWNNLKELLISTNYVVMHNASFDLRHLRAVLEIYSAKSIKFPYLCSLELSRKNFPDMQSHSLDKMAAHFGFSFKHHDALEDAFVCAAICEKMNFSENDAKLFEFSTFIQ